MTGSDRDAVHEQLAKLADDAGGVVFRASRRAGVDQDDVVLLERADNAVADQRSVIRRDGQAGWLTAPFAHLSRKHDRVEVDDGAGRHRRAGLDEL